MEFLVLRFNNTVVGNESDHDVGIGSQLIKIAKKFKYLGSVVQKKLRESCS